MQSWNTEGDRFLALGINQHIRVWAIDDAVSKHLSAIRCDDTLHELSDVCLHANFAENTFF